MPQMRHPCLSHRERPQRKERTRRRNAGEGLRSGEGTLTRNLPGSFRPRNQSGEGFLPVGEV
jgi:hypothetical protein